MLTPLKTLISFVKNTHANGYISQQNDAWIHWSTLTKDWLHARNIPPMSWPAHSLDPNPLQNLLVKFARRVYVNWRQSSSLFELKTSVTEEWNKISLEECYNITRSMAR